MNDTTDSVDQLAIALNRIRTIGQHQALNARSGTFARCRAKASYQPMQIIGLNFGDTARRANIAHHPAKRPRCRTPV